MRRISLELTAECAACLLDAVGEKPINPSIEAILWDVPAVQDAAKRRGIKYPVLRRNRGRPKRDASKAASLMLAAVIRHAINEI